MVTMSQATAARSVKHWSISDSFSPKPTIKDVLVIKLAFLSLQELRDFWRSSPKVGLFAGVWEQFQCCD